MTGSPIARMFGAQKSLSSFTAMSVAVGASAIPLFYVLEPHLVLTALSAMLFVTAAVAAIVALSVKTRKNSEKINLWDVAGGLVITGCAASVLGEPEHAAQLFEHLFERGSKTQ